MITSIANQIYADRYNNVYPCQVRKDWRRRDLLSWFHPYSLMNKMGWACFIVAIIIGFSIRYTHALTALQFLGLQVIFLWFIKQPDRSTGEPLVTDVFNMVKIITMWAGWGLAAVIN